MLNLIKFGNWLKEQRQRNELTIAQLAILFSMSKTKTIEIERMISIWENGESIPNERHTKKLCSVLGISTQDWSAAYNKLVEQYKDSTNLKDKSILAQNRSLIARHVALLRENQSKICHTQQWNDIQLHDFKVGLMYIGGNAIMRLGTLLSCWKDGLFIANEDNKPFYALSGGGSPLSSMQVVHGFYEGETTIHRKESIFRPLGHYIMPVLERLQKPGIGVSGWSLPQLLAQLGVDIPRADIQVNGEPWGEYCFHSSMLITENKQINFPLSLDHKHHFIPIDRSIKEEYSSKHQGGKLVISNLQTMQFGTWLGTSWQLKDQEGSRWLLKSNGLEDPQRERVVRWNIDIPPLVGEWLFKHLILTTP